MARPKEEMANKELLEQDKKEGKRGRGRPKGSKLEYKLGKQGKFTKAMEVYSQMIHKGYSQIQAYRKAYPEKALKLSFSGVATNAFKLYHNKDVQKRLDELIAIDKREGEQAYLWTRDKAINDLIYLEELGVKEVQRIENARSEQIEIYEEYMDEELKKDEPDLKKIKAYREIINEIKQKRLISMTQITAIKNAIDGLNTMHGYNEYNINNNNQSSGVVKLEFDYGNDDEYNKYTEPTTESTV